MNGFLLVDKPAGWTSHDVIGFLRPRLNIKTMGHAGTLDPFATGLLILGLGTATKQLEEVKNTDKVYCTTFVFGAQSDTDDVTGTIVEDPTPPHITREDTDRILPQFLGTIAQIPPMYSAKKIKGKKLYDIAREGRIVERAAASVTIHAIDILDDTLLPKEITLRITCGSGTYIRALARDMGIALDTHGYVKELRRERIGKYLVSDAKTPKEIVERGEIGSPLEMQSPRA